ncbi:MAG: hypothetical protein ACOX8H_00700 [Ruminococcus sp.]|jgi:hypothetical protein
MKRKVKGFLLLAMVLLLGAVPVTAHGAQTTFHLRLEEEQEQNQDFTGKKPKVSAAESVSASRSKKAGSVNTQDESQGVMAMAVCLTAGTVIGVLVYQRKREE